MSKSQLSVPGQDLATRAFKNPYFNLAWIASLVVILKWVWPLRDALLVIWVYGSDAYFHKGIRVIKGKPTTFSNGVLSPDFPDIVTGFGVFIITVLGLSLLLFHALRFYEKHLNKHTVTLFNSWVTVRDIIFVLVVFELAPYLAAIVMHGTVHEEGHYTVADAVAMALSGILAFALIGCLAQVRRWPHLIAVAIGAWLFIFLKAIFIVGQALAGILVAIFLALVMAVGGALSYLFKKDNRPPA